MSALEQDLLEMGYERAVGIDAQRVWDASQRGARLREVVADERADPVARFVAAEALAAHTATDGLTPDQLAAAYVDGLRAGATAEAANDWGIPGIDVGALAERVIALGEAARRRLPEALADERPLVFIGSREATIGNGYAWRVKDQAALMLAQILGEDFPLDRDPAARDRSIEALRGPA